MNLIPKRVMDQLDPEERDERVFTVTETTKKDVHEVSLEVHQVLDHVLGKRWTYDLTRRPLSWHGRGWRAAACGMTDDVVETRALGSAETTDHRFLTRR